MQGLGFGQLMTWALAEYTRLGSVFSIRKPYRGTGGKSLEIFEEKIELPLGPAAGPHTQLAQNIVAGYVAGARFFELKTVQFIDDGKHIHVSKPCILAQDEGYNVEWSTELYVHDAMDEYIKGWFALKLLSREFELGESDGFVFNMSIGYDLKGIKTEKIDHFIEGLKNAENTESWKKCKQWALENLSDFKRVDKSYIDCISPKVSRSVTLSTMHGCPPEEIERIATYLLTEKKLHTFIKCNPTLLGYKWTRSTLDNLGFNHVKFDDRHFKSDLQFEDAVPMLQKLISLADGIPLAFGVKLTNTLPVRITRDELPGDEMYVSGRPLFPLAIELANRLSKAFEGKLRISYSGGADIHNIDKIYETGIWPITLSTALLKPGGYMHMHQLAKKLAGCEFKYFESVDLKKLQSLVDWAASTSLYRKLKRDRTECATVCKCCVDVCPNRANIVMPLDNSQHIVHIDAMCNGCGNCKVFCRDNSAPYGDKFTLFTCAESFEKSNNLGFLILEDGTIRIRMDCETQSQDNFWHLVHSVLNTDYLQRITMQ